MGLLTKTRESDRLIAAAAKEQATLDAHLAQAGAAKADYDRAFEAGDAEAMIAAEGREKAHNALIAKQRDILTSLGERTAIAINAEEEVDFSAYCEGLDRQEERRAATYGRDYNKAAAALTAFLADDAAKTEPVVVANKRLIAMGRKPIQTAEERARTTPGHVEPAVYETREVWRRPSDGATPSTFVKGLDGEMRPQEAGYEKVREKVCVSPERHIAPQCPKSFSETVVLEGFKAGDPPLWPARGVR